MKRLPKWLKFLLGMGLALAIAGAVAGYCIASHPDSAFTKRVVIPMVKPIVDLVSGFEKHKNVDQSKPAFTLSPNELQGAFVKDEAAAKTTYEGKVVQVNGTISSIASPTDTNVVVLLTIEGDAASNVSCQMDPAFNSRMNGIAAGSVISVKGICNGSKKDDLFGSHDVLLNRCVIVN